MVVQSIADPAPAYRGKQLIVGVLGAYANKPPAAFISFFGIFRGILSRAEIEFAEEEEDSDSEVLEGTKAARIGLNGLDA